jgi:hypothetical protein
MNAANAGRRAELRQPRLDLEGGDVLLLGEQAIDKVAVRLDPA